MAIPTPTEIAPVIDRLWGLTFVLHGAHLAALKAALSEVSPVVKLSLGLEAIYAAIKQDATLTGAELVLAATACKQAGYIMIHNQWHGKEQRCADMGVVCEIVADTGSVPASGGPDVDPAFAVPLPVAPAPHLAD